MTQPIYCEMIAIISAVNVHHHHLVSYKTIFPLVRTCSQDWFITGSLCFLTTFIQFLLLHTLPFQFSSVQSLSRVRLFATPWIAARQASLSITNSWSSFKLMSVELVMPSGHLILCCPLFLLPPIPPSIRVFSNESTLCMRWPKYWSFSFSIVPSKEHPGLISFRMDWLDLLAVQGTLKRQPSIWSLFLWVWRFYM